MGRVRQRDTRPELALRQALWQRGVRYRINRRIEGVRVDIAMIGARLVVFVDGCFWHSCPVHATKPTNNADFWATKFAANRARDERQTAKLMAAGWRVLRLWEHECVGGCVAAVERVLAELRQTRDQRDA